MIDNSSITKARVPVADGPLKKHQFVDKNLTTANFMQFGIADSREMIPNEHGKVNHTTFLRCDPLDKPCLGSAAVYNRAFYVPFRTVWPASTDFFQDVRHVTYEGSSIISAVPYLQPLTVTGLLSQDPFSVAVNDDDAYDFVYDGIKYRFTYRGRLINSILIGLGYRVYSCNSDSVFLPESALPLLCAAKCYLDWFFPNAYSHVGLYATIDGIFQREFTYTLSESDLGFIFDLLSVVPYHSSFLTSVWDNPVAPSNDTGSIDFVLRDISRDTISNSVSSFGDGAVTQLGNGTPIANVKDGFTQYSDSALKALTNYIKMHQLAGSRSLDRYLLQHGIKLDADALKRSYYLGQDVSPFEISDVMSTADTTSGNSGSSLGSYAGKGIALSKCEFDFDVLERGFFIIVSTIMPDVDYIQGISRDVMHTTKLDFHTSQFDSLGVQAVSRAEVAVSMVNYAYNIDVQKNVFGFAPRYYEYAIGRSRQCGDFACNSVNGSLFGWSTARLFDIDDPNTVVDNSQIVHSLDFCLGWDALQYSRIFLGYPINGDDNVSRVDPFKVVHIDRYEEYKPKDSLYDVYEFENMENHQLISIEPNGIKVD